MSVTLKNLGDNLIIAAVCLFTFQGTSNVAQISLWMFWDRTNIKDLSAWNRYLPGHFGMDEMSANQMFNIPSIFCLGFVTPQFCFWHFCVLVFSVIFSSQINSSYATSLGWSLKFHRNILESSVLGTGEQSSFKLEFCYCLVFIMWPMLYFKKSSLKNLIYAADSLDLLTTSQAGHMSVLCEEDSWRLLSFV